MSERKTINTNIRLDLSKPADLEAWNHLQNLDRKQHRSYSRAVVAAINDYFGRLEKLQDDPYLETREKEDAFLKRVEDAVRQGAKESMPFLLAGNLIQALQPALNQTMLEQNQPAVQPEQEQDDTLDDALDFADSF